MAEASNSESQNLDQNMSGETCIELALEGERLCKSGDCRSGVSFFEAAIQVGTDDMKTLSAIYSQLGNAYFYLGEYGKALEYHRHDLTLARTISDPLGEAKASGNLGNTLKVLGQYEEAILCCKRHLDISKELHDKVGEGRALYNLGNVYHAKGKQAGRMGHQDPGDFPDDVKVSLQKAAEHYEANLKIVEEVGDRGAQGRACGNLGNTHYLLGNFTQAIRYHEERLKIAKEFGDKAAERRAYSNLGNSHVFLGEFEVAADHYLRTLQIARDIGDRAVEAQACYSLGNTYTLLRDYEKAIYYHNLHLQIAQELGDRVGEGRACWSLGNAYTALGDHEKALEYATKHLHISKEVGDYSGEETAKSNVNDLQASLGVNSVSLGSDTTVPVDAADAAATREARLRRISMEKMDLVSMSPNVKASNLAMQPVVEVPGSDASMEQSRQRKRSSQQKISPDMLDEEGLFEIISRMQDKRMNDQRCSFDLVNQASTNGIPVGAGAIGNHTAALPQTEEQKQALMDMIAGFQADRLNDQRATLPVLPGLQVNDEAVIGQLLAHSNQEGKSGIDLEDSFLEMLMRCQATRLEDQRSSLPLLQGPPAPTVPDEDFYNLIMRMQSSRLNDQRSNLPESGDADSTQQETSSRSVLPSLRRDSKKSSKKKK